MFDKLFKKKNQELAGDNFFKAEPAVPQKSDDLTTANPTEQLADDLKAFDDDLKIKKTLKETMATALPPEKIKAAEPLAEDIQAEEKVLEKWPKKKTKEEIENDQWLDKDYEDGELAVDVYQDESNVYVKSTIAGVNPDDIDISIHNDMLTIRGKRSQDKERSAVDYFYQECFWGSFSRSIILPVEVKADKIDAFLKDGILTVVLPKIKKGQSAKIKVVGK